MHTGAWPDVRHVDEGSCALDEGWVVQGDTGAETLRVDSLAELSIGHRDGGLVISWGKKCNQQQFFPLGTIFAPQISLCLYPTMKPRKVRSSLPINGGGNLVLERSCSEFLGC